MICCKCKKPIERSYGRVADLGNYCRECAIQNEIEATKVHNQFDADINKKLNRLAELEDKIGQGKLMEINKPFIKKTKYGLYMICKATVIVVEDFDTKAEAEKKLKELKGE